MNNIAFLLNFPYINTKYNKLKVVLRFLYLKSPPYQGGEIR